LDCLLKMNQYSLLEEVHRNQCERTYPGHTGKLSLAYDEWLELNNKEYALYPSVQTLEGMSRQGQFIGLTQKEKRVVEMIYSTGAITNRIVHRSGNGSKGNCSPEKKLIAKVISLFLGNPFDQGNAGRLLETRFMITLQPLITTKLDQKKLEKEISFIQHEDSAGILLNGVNHIHGRINVSKEREQLTNKDQPVLHESVNDVIDEVMEYEPEMLVPNIDDHVFNDNEQNDDEIEEEEQMLESERPCLIDLVDKGWKKLGKMNVRKVRMVADEPTQRKRETTYYMMDRVSTMREQTMPMSIPPDMGVSEESEWGIYLRELRFNYYN
jgi:hypothetical protein